MCFSQKLDIKMVFWTLLISLGIMIIAITVCLIALIKFKIEYEENANYLTNRFEMLSKFLIASCIIILIIAITGLVSVIVDWYPFLIIHAFIFLGLSLYMIAAGCYVIGQSHDVHGRSGLLEKTLHNFEEILKKPEWFSFNITILDPVQRSLSCCGVYNWRDYWRPLQRSWIGDMLPLPKSCCDDQNYVCMPLKKTERQDGCMKKVVLYFTVSFNEYGIIIFIFGVSAAINSGFLFILARKAKEYYYFYPYYM